jgi:hypothetical protein
VSSLPLPARLSGRRRASVRRRGEGSRLPRPLQCLQLPAFRLALRSTAARCGRCSARPSEPSFERSRDLLVGAPRPDQEIPVGGCPLPRAQQRDLGVHEASKSVISRPSFQPPTAFDGERDQPGLIAAAAPLGRCVPPT